MTDYPLDPKCVRKLCAEGPQGEGPWIDFRSGEWMTHICGGNEYRFAYAWNGYWDNDDKAHAQSVLQRILPRHLNRAIFLNSGGEAVDCALRIAKSCERGRVLAFGHEYHGNLGSIYALHHHNMPWTSPNCDAILFTPFNGPSMQFLEPKAVDGMIEWRKRTGGLLICDEMQGFFRTCKWWAHQWLNKALKPDLMLAGKAIGNGVPVAFVAGSASLLDRDEDADFTSTFSGNPVAMRAMADTITTCGQLTKERDAIANAMDLWIWDTCGDKVEYAIHGAMCSVRCADADSVRKRCYARKVLLLPTAGYIKIVPPMTMSLETLCNGLAIVQEEMGL